MKALLLLYCLAIISNPFICSSTIMLLKNYRYVVFFSLEERLKNVLLIKYQKYLNNNTNLNDFPLLSKNNSKKLSRFLEDNK
jgi:hypothetical protein